ncbi:MAG: nif-specific transcriptional activator NifA [Filomicrobium sp.]
MLNYDLRAVETLYEVSKILAGPGEQGALLSPVLKVLGSFVGLRYGSVHLLQDPPDDSCDGVVNPHYTAATTNSESPEPHNEDRIPDEVIDTVFMTGVAYIMQHIAEGLPHFDIPERLKSDLQDRVAILAVPIPTQARGGAVRGVVGVFRTYCKEDPPQFDQDIRILKMVATLISQSLEFRDIVARDRQRLLEEQRSLQNFVGTRAYPPSGGTPVRPANRKQKKDPGADYGIVGQSPIISDVLARLKKVAQTQSTVLLRGESGTGKELFARATHEMSRCSSRPFVKVNCAALSESLLESELFGHEKGAFTGATTQRKGRFEMADGGTLFLDEIGEISASFQAKLLRALQEGEFERVGGTKTVRVNVRLICATNKDLEQAVSKGDFRADLYYRICVVPILLPPLRERSDDIPKLAEAFLQRFNEENATHLSFGGQALNALVKCKFPGNVRELQNCVYRVASMAAGPTIDFDDFSCQQGACLSAQIWQPEGSTVAAARVGQVVTPVTRSLPVINGPAQPPANCPARSSDGERNQRDDLIDAMEKSGWVQAKAARMLGMTPRQIGYALKKHNIQIKRF